MRRHTDRSDEDLLAIPAKNFPYNMTEAEQVRWLRLVPEDHLHVAERVAPVLQPESVVRKITEEIGRRVQVKALLAAQAVVPKQKTWWQENWKWVVASILLPIVLWCLKLLLGQ